MSATYANQPTTVDFAHYRSVLKNQAIVDEAEKLLKEFKPITYDVSATLKAIETFEAKAVRVHSLRVFIGRESSHTVACSIGGQGEGD